MGISTSVITRSLPYHLPRAWRKFVADLESLAHFVLATENPEVRKRGYFDKVSCQDGNLLKD